MPHVRVSVAAIRAAWLNPSISVQEAATAVGYKRRKALWKRAKGLGLPPRPMGRKPVIDGALLAEMWLSNVSSHDIAHHFGVKQPSVSQAARKAGLPPRRGGPQMGVMRIHEFWLRRALAVSARMEQAAMINAEMADGTGKAGMLVGQQHARAA